MSTTTNSPEPRARCSPSSIPGTRAWSISRSSRPSRTSRIPIRTTTRFPTTSEPVLTVQRVGRTSALLRAAFGPASARGGVAQLVRVSACHAEGRGFEPRRSRQSSLAKRRRLPRRSPKGEARAGCRELRRQASLRTSQSADFVACLRIARKSPEKSCFPAANLALNPRCARAALPILHPRNDTGLAWQRRARAGRTRDKAWKSCCWNICRS